MADFQYKSGANWLDVPDYAHPDADGGSITIEYPAAPDLDGAGNPAGAMGQPELVITGSFMTGTGMAGWMAFFGDTVVETATLTGITGWDRRTGAWAKYTGILWRPTGKCKPGATAAATSYSDVQIRVKNLTVTT